MYYNYFHLYTLYYNIYHLYIKNIKTTTKVTKS